MAFNPSASKLVTLDNLGFHTVTVKCLADLYFPDGFEYEENLLSVPLKEFWDLVKLLYVRITMDCFLKQAFVCWTLCVR